MSYPIEQPEKEFRFYFMVYWKIAKAQNWHSEALKKTYRVLRWPGSLGFNSFKAILISNSHGNRRHNIFFLSFDMNIWKYENPFQKCQSHPVKLWLRLVVPTIWPAHGWDVQVSEKSWGHSVCGLKQISKYGIWPWRPSLPLYLLLNCSLPGPQCGVPISQSIGSGSIGVQEQKYQNIYSCI